MKRSRAFSSFLKLSVAAGVAAALLASPAVADNPGSISPADEPARAAFEKFAQSWMEKIKRTALEQRPSVSPGATDPVVTYRGYGDDFTVELRPTGHAAAPYVGILRYQEQILNCRNITANDCSVSSHVPVTEIFRYQDGRWVY